jgi:TPR repeat protein
MILGEVFQVELPADGTLDSGHGRTVTVLKALYAGMATRLSALGDPTVTGTGVSSAQALGVPVELLTQTLIKEVLEQIRMRALGGGPLEPLARQLNDDATHLQLRDQARLGLRTATAVEQLAKQLAGLTEQTRPHPLRSRPVADCDPLKLGVHRSITSTVAQPPNGRSLPMVLPLWVTRDVESRVQDAVAAAAGQGGLVVLVGGASTGKTRLAYQALLAKLHNWRLYQPADPTELATAVAGGQLPQGGWVVWLDDFQDYISRDLALATVRALLDPDRPMVLLATLELDCYGPFTATPSPPSPLTGRRLAARADARDPLRDARKILTTAADAIIWVDDFSREERQRAKQLAGQDPRLAVALDDPDFGPTQVLAAAPQLVDHWEHASDPYGKELLTSAIDAQRLGHLGPLPARLLEAAARDYLTNRQRATAKRATWFAKALAYATTPLVGETAALLPVAGHGIGPIGYTVANYLLQHGRARRRWSPPPASLWDAAVEHTASVADRVRLAREAFGRCLYQQAVLLLIPAATTGNIRAMRELAQHLRDALHHAAAEGWWRRAAETGDPDAMLGLVELLMEGRRDKEAMSWLRLAVETGSVGAMQELAWRLQQAGNREAGTWWRRAAETGDPDAMQALAHWLEGAARGEEAAGWYRKAAEAGDPVSMKYLAQWLEEAGRGEEAGGWYQRAAESGNSLAMLALFRWLERAGRGEEAADWYRRIAESSSSPAIREVARWLEQAGPSEDPEIWYRRLADHPERMRALAWWLQQAGRGQEAECLYRLAAETVDPDAIRDLAQWLEEAGHGEEAARWYRHAAEAGDPEAMRALAQCLERASRGEEAEHWWRRAAEAGLWDAMMDLTQWLERVGRGEEAEQLRRFGLQPGGRTADPWSPPTATDQN